MKQRAQTPRFVVCVKNRGFPASLERRKVYRVLADAVAENRHLLRVVDESGDAYLYPESYFVALELPMATARAISAAS